MNVDCYIMVYATFFLLLKEMEKWIERINIMQPQCNTTITHIFIFMVRSLESKDKTVWPVIFLRQADSMIILDILFVYFTYHTKLIKYLFSFFFCRK